MAGNEPDESVGFIWNVCSYKNLGKALTGEAELDGLDPS